MFKHHSYDAPTHPVHFRRRPVPAWSALGRSVMRTPRLGIGIPNYIIRIINNQLTLVSESDLPERVNSRQSQGGVYGDRNDNR